MNENTITLDLTNSESTINSGVLLIAMGLLQTFPMNISGWIVNIYLLVWGYLAVLVLLVMVLVSGRKKSLINN